MVRGVAGVTVSNGRPATQQLGGVTRRKLGGVGLEYDLILFGLHCFLQLAHVLYCRSGRCLASVVTKE